MLLPLHDVWQTLNPLMVIWLVEFAFDMAQGLPNLPLEDARHLVLGVEHHGRMLQLQWLLPFLLDWILDWCNHTRYTSSLKCWYDIIINKRRVLEHWWSMH